MLSFSSFLHAKRLLRPRQKWKNCKIEEWEWGFQTRVYVVPEYPICHAVRAFVSCTNYL
jgi:hypothetical protein